MHFFDTKLGRFVEGTAPKLAHTNHHPDKTAVAAPAKRKRLKAAAKKKAPAKKASSRKSGKR
jgi:hypothetical protein